MIWHLSLRARKQGKEPKEVEIDSENMMGEVLWRGAESHFKTLCEDINLSTGCVSHWISTVSWSQPCQMWIHYQSDKINLFLLTEMFCQGSHLSQCRSCSPSLYRKSKTNKQIYLAIIKQISNKRKKNHKMLLFLLHNCTVHNVQGVAGIMWPNWKMKNFPPTFSI